MAVDILTAVNWVIFYYILQKNTEYSIFKNKTHKYILCGITALIIFIATIYNFADVVEFHSISNKYEVYHDNVQLFIKNIDSVHGTRNLLLDTLMGISIYFLHLKQTPKCDDIKRHDFVSLFLLRVVIVGAVFFALTFAKAIIYPKNVLSGFSIPSTNSYSMIERFNINSYTKAYSRMIDRDSDQEFYNKTTCEISYANKKLTSFDIVKADGVMKLSIDGSVMHMHDGGEKYEVECVEFYVYVDTVICFIDDEKPTLVYFEDIKNQPETKKLTLICKELISKGNIKAFEYASEYLNKYEKEFITPYIDRIANEEFTDDELQSFSYFGYRKDYITSLAKGFLET